MNPEELLTNTMGGLWTFIKENDYLYFVLAVIVIVLVWKVVKASAKTVIKIGLVLLAIYILKKFIFG